MSLDFEVIAYDMESCWQVCCFMKGALGFSVLPICPMFGSVFRYSHLKTAVFRFRCLPRFAAFLQFGLWFFGFRQQWWRFFGYFLSYAFNCFSGFAEEVTPRSRAKTIVLPRDHLHSVLPILLEEWMTTWKSSPFNSRYLGRNGKAQDNIKAKDYSQILRGRAMIISCGLWS